MCLFGLTCASLTRWQGISRRASWRVVHYGLTVHLRGVQVVAVKICYGAVFVRSALLDFNPSLLQSYDPFFFIFHPEGVDKEFEPYHWCVPVPLDVTDRRYFPHRSRSGTIIMGKTFTASPSPAN